MTTLTEPDTDYIAAFRNDLIQFVKDNGPVTVRQLMHWYVINNSELKMSEQIQVWSRLVVEGDLVDAELATKPTRYVVSEGALK